MNYKIINGLPNTRKWTKTKIGQKSYKGILWDKRDIWNNDTLLLYKDWSKEFFDSNWYEIGTGVISEEASTRRDIELLKETFKERLNPKSRLIDVHCGSGRHLIKLAQDGIFGIGMEGASLLRRLAKQKSKGMNLPIEFFSTSDYCKKQLSGKADLVTTLFNSMGYTFNTDDELMRFKWIVNLLKPGGLYLLDIRAENFQIDRFSSPKRTQENFKLNIDTNKTSKDIQIDILKYWKNKTLAVKKRITCDGRIVQDTTYGWRTYSIQEIQSMLKVYGCQLKETRQDYYTIPKNAGERILLLFQKD